MFKKTFSINNQFLYDYICNHTEERFIFFGYFLYAKNYFYGKLDNNIIKVYCSDITLCFFNPKIIVEKNEQNNVLITITYNIIHYLLITLILFICVFSAIVCFAFPINIFCSIIAIAIILFLYKMNFYWQQKKIMDHLFSINIEDGSVSDENKGG